MSVTLAYDDDEIIHVLLAGRIEATNATSAVFLASKHTEAKMEMKVCSAEDIFADDDREINWYWTPVRDFDSFPLHTGIRAVIPGHVVAKVLGVESHEDLVVAAEHSPRD